MFLIKCSIIKIIVIYFVCSLLFVLKWMVVFFFRHVLLMIYKLSVYDFKHSPELVREWDRERVRLAIRTLRQQTNEYFRFIRDAPQKYIVGGERQWQRKFLPRYFHFRSMSFNQNNKNLKVCLCGYALVCMYMFAYDCVCNWCDQCS